MRQSIEGYRQILAYPGAKSLLLLSFITRAINIPLGALLTVIAFGSSDSWSIAAVAGGVASLASALSFWLSGKAMDKWNPRIVLLLFLPGSLLPLLFYFDFSNLSLILVSLLVGLARPPSGTTLRTSWQRVVSDDNKKVLAYSLDASLAPVAGSLGSALGAILLLLFSYSGVILFLVILATISTLALAFHPATHKHEVAQEEDSVAKEKAALGSRVWIAVGLVGLSWAALVGLELLVGDRFGPQALLYLNSAGALLVALGAFYTGRTRDKTGRQALLSASLAASGSLVIITLGFFVYLPLAILPVILFAMSRGMISATASTYLSIYSPKERRSEALALYGSGVLVGQAIYRPLSGLMLVYLPILILLLPAALFATLASLLYQRS